MIERLNSMRMAEVSPLNVHSSQKGAFFGRNGYNIQQLQNSTGAIFRGLHSTETIYLYATDEGKRKAALRATKQYAKPATWTSCPGDDYYYQDYDNNKDDEEDKDDYHYDYDDIDDCDDDYGYDQYGFRDICPDGYIDSEGNEWD